MRQVHLVVMRLLGRDVRPLLLLIAAISLLSPTLRAQVSGSIASDTTWTESSSPVLVSGTVVVPSGRTLSIESGTIVTFAAGSGLVVEGKLVATGTAADTIVFTSSAPSPSRGDWNGIEFRNTSNVGSTLRYVRVEWTGAGSSQAAIYYGTGAYGVALENIHVRESSGDGVNLRASSLAITDSRFEQITGYGVFSDLFSNFQLRRSVVEYCTEGGVRIPLNAAPTVDSTVIRHNGYGIYVDNGASPTITRDTIASNATGIYFRSVGGVQPVVRENVISGNTEWGINAEGSIVLDARRNYWGSEYGPFSEQINPSGRGNKVSVKVEVAPWRSSGTMSVTNITSNISANTTWTAGVYWVKNNITVNSGVTLTLRPGAIVKMAPSTQIYVSGALSLQSTYDSLAVFTSERDDSYGGDSNGDGDATVPAAGNWSQIQFANSATLAHVIVKYGSYNLYFSGTTANVSYLYSSLGSTYGLYADSGPASITITDSHVTGNGNTGAQLFGSNGAVVNVDRSSFLRNGLHGLFLNNGSMASFDSSVASSNAQFGVYTTQSDAASSQSFTNSTFAKNGHVGLAVGSIKSSPITIANNVFEGNGQEGLLTSRATISNNAFTGNRLPLALQLNVGSTYSGNTFTGNLYNAVTGLRSMYSSPSSLKGTLSTVTPAGLASGVYLLLKSESVSSTDTLMIAPGVIVKSWPGLSLDFYGVLVADGTPAQPIAFTSYRDHSRGGKVNLVADTLAAAIGDWSGTNFYGSPVRATMDHVQVLYSSNGIQASSTWSQPLTNITLERNSNGAYLNGGNVVFDGATIRFNTTGMYALNSTDLTVRNSLISQNTQHGISYSSTISNPPIGGLRELSNSQITNNGQRGVNTEPVQVPQVFVGNTVSGNGQHGIWNVNHLVGVTDVQYIGNTISNNGLEGIVSSRARFVDNTFSGNRYPIGVAGKLGNLYVDNTGTDNNVFINNRRPAIAVHAKSWGSGSITDTLKRQFPAGLTSGVYVAESYLSIAAGDTLVIQPGVVLKVGQSQQIDVYGRFIAQGTAVDPIIVTSYRDHAARGKTNEPTDTVKAAPGDWYGLSLQGTGNVTGSRIEHVQFRFASYAVSVYTQLVNPFRNISARRNSQAGLQVSGDYDLAVVGLVADSNFAGVWARNEGSVSIDSGAMRWNTFGLYGDYTISNVGSGRFASVTNSVIGWNTSDGARMLLAKEPQVFQDNLVTSNGRHGIWNYSESAVYDTLLLLSSNTISNNAETGVLSSRAYFVDDSLLNNKYPLGVTGELSKSGTGTALGNYYSGNVLLGNTYNNVITVYDNIWGTLGGTLPADTVEYVHRLESTPTVQAQKSLVVAPGTVVKSTTGQYLSVTGALTSEGTSTKRITFTSWKDDTFGGDTNKDSSVTSPAAGDWSGVYLYPGAGADAKSFRFTNVRFASYGLYISGANNGITVDSSFLSNNSTGIYRTNATGSLTVTGSDIHSNTQGVQNTAGGTVTIAASNIYNNSSFGVYHSSSNNLTASNNYWGAASGPLVQTGPDLNPTGTGNKIQNASSGYVIYRPFLTARGGILAGDVSQNGTISAFDASLTLQHVVGAIVLSAPQQTAADVTANGAITAMDASYILRYVVGLVTGFPGLGRVVGTPQAPGYALATRTIEGSDDLEAVVSLKASGVYATQMKIAFDSTQVRPVAVAKALRSDSLQLAWHVSGQELRVAQAGAQPVSAEGAWVTVRFERIASGGPTGSIAVTEFLVNEAGIATSAEEAAAEIPTTFGLDQNFPNPFNPSTTVRFQLPAASRVTLKVFDVLGREVATLIQSELAAGFHQSTWDGMDVAGRLASSGMYLLVMQAEPVDGQPFRSVRKMILTK